MSAKEHGEMIGCNGTTYKAKKADLLRQLGYQDVIAKHFKGMTETQIDQKARTIMSKPPAGYKY